MGCVVNRWPTEPALRANPMTVDQLSTVAGISKATLYGPTLNDVQADRLAIALGKHPFDLWPEWFDAPADACDCGAMFSTRAGRRVCLPCDRVKSARYRERVKVAS